MGIPWEFIGYPMSIPYDCTWTSHGHPMGIRSGTYAKVEVHQLLSGALSLEELYTNTQ